MKIEDQVVSIKHSKEFAELGVKQDSLFSWIEYEGKIDRYWDGCYYALRVIKG